MPVIHSISLTIKNEVLVIQTTLSDHRLTAFADRLKECKHVLVVRQVIRFDSGLATVIAWLFDGYNSTETETQIKQIFNESLL